MKFQDFVDIQRVKYKRSTYWKRTHHLFIYSKQFPLGSLKTNLDSTIFCTNKKQIHKEHNTAGKYTRRHVTTYIKVCINILYVLWENRHQPSKMFNCTENKLWIVHTLTQFLIDFYLPGNLRKSLPLLWLSFYWVYYKMYEQSWENSVNNKNCRFLD